MTFEELDKLILLMASPHWQKVAMIIAKVSQNERYASTNVDNQLDLIADRIGNLVANDNCRPRVTFQTGGTVKFGLRLKSSLGGCPNRWTRTAGAASRKITGARWLNEIAPPRQLKRSTACSCRNLGTNQSQE